MNKTQKALKLALGYMNGTLVTDHLTGYERKRYVMEAIREALADHIGDDNKMVEQPAYRAVKTWHDGKPVYVAEQPAQHQYTYASTQATMCAGCGEHKHTPLRIDAMGGYVCLTCIDQKLGSLLGEFGYPEPEQPAQQQEIEELTTQRDKLADILTRTANVLKGQPARTAPHSWYDLPEVAQQLKAAQQQEPDRVKFERHWRKTRGEKKANRELPRHPLQPQTYTQDSANRHWVTWQAAVRSVFPPASKPLTDEFILSLHYGCSTALKFARAIEAAHGIKENT